MFLKLLIELTLKISEELIRYTDHGGDLEFIDWPMYGEHLAVVTANGNAAPQKILCEAKRRFQ